MTQQLEFVIHVIAIMNCQQQIHATEFKMDAAFTRIQIFAKINVRSAYLGIF
jgi:hypothetical protein